MLLSAHEIAQGREQTLFNFLSLSGVWLQAGQQLTVAMAMAGREGFQHGAAALPLSPASTLPEMVQWPFSWWLDNMARVGQLINNAMLVYGEAQQALIRSADMQVQILDGLAISAINRACRSSPWEAEVPLQVMKTSLQAARQAMHEINEVAAEEVESLICQK